MIVILFSCRNSKYEAILDAETPGSEADYSAEKRLNRLVAEVESLQSLEGKYIGIEGRPSSQKQYPPELAKFGDTASLVLLTNHKNPLVRVLSFEALHLKGYKGLKKILVDHLTDTSTYWVFAGCLVTPQPVNLSMLNLIEDQLYSHEILSFKARIKESFEGAWWYRRMFFPELY